MSPKMSRDDKKKLEEIEKIKDRIYVLEQIKDKTPQEKQEHLELHKKVNEIARLHSL